MPRQLASVSGFISACVSNRLWQNTGEASVHQVRLVPAVRRKTSMVAEENYFHCFIMVSLNDWRTDQLTDILICDAHTLLWNKPRTASSAGLVDSRIDDVLHQWLKTACCANGSILLSTHAVNIVRCSLCEMSLCVLYNESDILAYLIEVLTFDMDWTIIELVVYS